MIIVTWINTRDGKGRSSLRTSSSTSFMALVLREGIIYFGYVVLQLRALPGIGFTCFYSVLLSLNVVQIIFAFYESTAFSLIIAFIDPYVARHN